MTYVEPETIGQLVSTSIGALLGPGQAVVGSSLGGLVNPSVAFSNALSAGALTTPTVNRLISDDNFTDLIFRGNTLSRDLSGFLTSINVTMGWDQITQIVLDFEDPNMQLLAQGFFMLDGQVSYRGQSFEISATVETAGQAGMGGATITLRPGIIEKFKQSQGPFVVNNISASDFVARECNYVKAKYITQDGGTPRTISRDVVTDVLTAKYTNSDEFPSAWTTIQRLAQEEGYAVFEFDDTIYFGQPTWLVTRKDCQDHVIYWNTPTATEYMSARSCPNVTIAHDQAWIDLTTVTVDIPLARAHEFRLGDTISLVGVPYFDTKHGALGDILSLVGTAPSASGTKAHYLVTNIAWDLGDDEVATITAQTPVNPQPTLQEPSNTDISQPALSSSSVSIANLPAGRYGGAYYDAAQMVNASIIYRVGVSKGISKSGLICALEVGIVEAHFRNLANGNVPASLSPIYHNQGVGFDHDSVGCFQQRANWGTLAQRMDVTTSAGLFYNAFLRLSSSDRLTLPPGTLAQDVQVSGTPDAYNAVQAQAVALYQAFSAASVSASTPAKTRRAMDMVTIALKQVGKPYAVIFPKTLNTQLTEFDCSLLVQWSAYQVGVTDYPRDTFHQQPWIRQHGLIISQSQAIATRGAVLFESNNQHTAISLGNGTMVEAATYGVGVVVSQISGRDMTVGGLIPGMYYG